MLKWLLNSDAEKRVNLAVLALVLIVVTMVALFAPHPKRERHPTDLPGADAHLTHE